MKINLDRLRAIQKKLAKNVIVEDRFKEPLKTVAGIDLAYRNTTSIVACVTVNFSTLDIINKKILTRKIKFPYKPSFLCFREGPPILEIINKLEVEPDIFLINAHGLAHPQLCGCASYVGVLLNRPTIGVAKNILCGEYCRKLLKAGEWVPLTFEGRVVGAVLNSKDGCKPIFVSPGHRISLVSSIDVINKCIRNHKMPEPLQYAHRLANEKKRI